MTTFFLKEPGAPAGMAGLLSRHALYLCGSLSLGLAFSACSGSGDSGRTTHDPSPPPPSSIALKLQPITTGLNAPVFMTSPPGDNSRLFIVEQEGKIKIIDVSTQSPLPATFLDLSAVITTGGEQGLLGMAFDPGYTNNGRFYVYYTDLSGNIVIARYLASTSNADLADPSTAFTLLTVLHPTNTNHNGGMLAFGSDGCLYAGTGDGGGGGDPDNNGQDTFSLLGKIIRLDPGSGSACTNSTTNPFASGVGGAPEVWSFGLRNPWRFSFDRQKGDLYIGDVGQGSREEVDVALFPNAGRQSNYGWSVMEGFLCFNPPSGCNSAGLTFPVLDYPHIDNACSIIGGYVYRGTAIPALNGTYFYADLCAGFVRSFIFQNAQVTNQFNWSSLNPGTSITSFGEDAQGELYIMSLSGGLWRIAPM